VNNPLKNRDLDGHWCLFGIVGNTCSPDLPPPPPLPPAPGTNPVYATVDQAGVAAAKADKHQTDVRRAAGHPVEYGNSVYSVRGVAYSYTDPITQNQRGTVDPNNTTGTYSVWTANLLTPPIPSGTQQVGEAHSHSDLNVDQSGHPLPPRDQLSYADMSRAAQSMPVAQKGFQAEYIALPNGDIIKYTSQNQITVLR
jgi:hypothetical protein